MNITNMNSHDQGVVIRKYIGHYHVRTEIGIFDCATSSKLRKQLIYSSANPNALHRGVSAVKTLDKVDPVAVGDRVRFVEAGDGTGLIIDVLPRRNHLGRRDPYPGSHAFEQVIVANVDCIIPVFAAANPTPKWGLLDRYLVSAEALAIPALIVITKLDLVRGHEAETEDAIRQVVEEYRRIGYPVLLTSSFTGEGLVELREKLKGRVSALVGKSGVGKTALLNAIEPGLSLRVGEVGRGSLGKGKHTTSCIEMVPLRLGGGIVDTPGMREFGLQEMSVEDLALFFPEMRPFVGKCKFGLGCMHEDEPGCSIRKQVMAGAISPLRYQSYQRLKEEILP